MYKQTLLATILVLNCAISLGQVAGSVTGSANNAPLAGVVVSNGEQVTITDSAGRYRFDQSSEHIFLTRTPDITSKHWYQPVVGTEVNFSLDAVDAEPLVKDFFFVQISDAHVYEKHTDFVAFSSPDLPWYLPDFVIAWFTVDLLKKGYGEDVFVKFKQQLQPVYKGDDLDQLSEADIYYAYAAELAKPNSALGSSKQAFADALDELEALRPEFIINTGDLVLEGNKGTPEAIDSWFEFYTQQTQSLTMPLYNTIGNNEIAGTERDDFAPEHPQFGKYFFKKYLGPTHFSFDFGDFHFVALDTHSASGEDNSWSFNKMEAHVSNWLKADLRQHQDKVLVALNHEPFHYDPSWPFDNKYGFADDEGLFAQFGVNYVLSGHTHWRSYQNQQGVHHITTGALSGMRWVLPATIHPRGYRLFYAHDKALYSAWKQTGQSVITMAEPQPDNKQLKVICLADQNQAFTEVELSANGQVIEHQRLGDYFVQLRLPENHQGGISVQATAKDGVVQRFDLVL